MKKTIALAAGLVLFRGRAAAVIGGAAALYAALTALLFFSRRGTPDPCAG